MTLRVQAAVADLESQERINYVATAKMEYWPFYAVTGVIEVK